MAIFLDSGDIAEIKRFKRMGVIRGVTTNPTILKKDGLGRGKTALRELEKTIADIISPLPLSVEVTGNRKKQMLEQAREFAAWAENINVKVPIHGPEGELFNLEVVYELENRYDIRVNVTACMSAQQGLLAALAGATYVSIFGGRINNMGHSSIDELTRLRDLIDDQGLKTKIIAGSTREILNVVEWLEAGAHIVTVTPAILEGMIRHPYTAETVKMFLRDAG
ncbi:MAG TPA: transaldolase family protein [bacterium]|nr:transaldolase family protein [bacterium]HPJ71284.1 transaldolase family protein [bacterium]HPQ65179.1 transaldolase family protein [bacterium]